MIPWLITTFVFVLTVAFIAYRVGRELAIRDLHIAAGKRLTRSEHRQMGQLMDKALYEEDTN